MGQADDGIVLTDREREVLAELAGSIGDPWLARQLTGGEAFASGATPRRRHRPSWLHRPSLGVLSGWAGVALLVSGAALALTTFMMSTILATVGLVVMGVGLWRTVADQSGVVARWVATRRAGRRPERPATPPPPPRTPPAAA